MGVVGGGIGAGVVHRFGRFAPLSATPWERAQPSERDARDFRKCRCFIHTRDSAQRLHCNFDMHFFRVHVLE